MAALINQRLGCPRGFFFLSFPFLFQKLLAGGRGGGLAGCHSSWDVEWDLPPTLPGAARQVRAPQRAASALPALGWRWGQGPALGLAVAGKCPSPVHLLCGVQVKDNVIALLWGGLRAGFPARLQHPRSSTKESRPGAASLPTAEPLARLAQPGRLLRELQWVRGCWVRAGAEPWSCLVFVPKGLCPFLGWFSSMVWHWCS